MPRIRSIKPQFFTDADLAAFPPLHRLAFEGLWCHADRDGRLEDKPRELKVKILPFDDCDFERILWDLAAPRHGGPGFILRYEVGQRRFIAVTNFSKHQKPHPKEPKSDMPGPDLSQPCKNRAEHVPAHVEPGGFLVLGSGSLVLGDGGNAPQPPEPISAMSALVVPSVVAGAEPDRRNVASPGAAIRQSATPTSPLGRTVSPPDTPLETWTGIDFWRWAQWRRQQSGLVPESMPQGLGGWWSGCLMTEGVTPHAMREGFNRFGKSKHWEKTEPPYPFAAFRKGWSDFVRAEVSHGAMA